jgi:thiamine-phosphate pyrophosphorylase
MMGKEGLLSKIQLYVIADRRICGYRDIEEVVGQAIEGGAQMIQYRDKDSGDAGFLSIASKLKAVCKERGVPFIINDRADIAREVNADGVHLGQKDLSINEARKILGPAGIIGKSAGTIHQARKAEEEGADYLGIGPIFDTLSKEIAEPIGLSIVPEARDSLKIPFYLIGGITKDNLDQIIEAEATRIAVISAVVLSDDVKSATADLLKKLKTGT